ncbi:hypothetical protein GCM10009789_12550 [Kribbella sancticallisti]|uniref:Uncharacterized protein n=1 Tax=Kribbella sancticallisti TaxID=460087 RepID=A0ABN2CNJ9_9ACTN
MAQRLGLSYSVRDQAIAEMVAGEHPTYKFRRANDVVQGNFFGFPVTAFNYSGYGEPSGGGKDSDVRHYDGYRYGYVWITLPARLPRLDVTRADALINNWDRILGWQPVRTESAAFDRFFNAKTVDDRFAHAVLHPRMMEFLLARNAPAIDIDGDRVILRRSGWFSPEDVWWGIHFLREFVQLIPPFVLRDYALK